MLRAEQSPDGTWSVLHDDQVVVSGLSNAAVWREHARTLRALRGLEATLREAIAESKLAYGFNPNSYSFGCMNACNAAEQALENLRAALESDFAVTAEPALHEAK
jgi:hypothetical protein